MSPHDIEQRTRRDNSYSEINLIEIPIRALRWGTRILISKLMNQKNMVFCTAEEKIRDCRRIISKIGIEYFDGDLTQINEFEHIIRVWERLPIKRANLWKFQNILGLVGRWDVVGKTNSLLYEDASYYLSECHINDLIVDIESCYISESKSRIKFDAVVLCANEDREFSINLLHKLERLNFKLCLQVDDDASMEHQTRLQNCDRLIIIVSPSFLTSQAYTLFQKYSQSLRYGEEKNKIIPYLYQSCQLPDSLRFYFVLSYIESSYVDKRDPLKESLASLTASEKERNSKNTVKRKQFFVTKFSLPRISNWIKWMKRLKKHKKCRMQVNQQFDDQPKRITEGGIINEKMLL